MDEQAMAGVMVQVANASIGHRLAGSLTADEWLEFLARVRKEADRREDADAEVDPDDGPDLEKEAAEIAAVDPSAPSTAELGINHAVAGEQDPDPVLGNPAGDEIAGDEEVPETAVEGADPVEGNEG